MFQPTVPVTKPPGHIPSQLGDMVPLTQRHWAHILLHHLVRGQYFIHVRKINLLSRSSSLSVYFSHLNFSINYSIAIELAKYFPLPCHQIGPAGGRPGTRGMREPGFLDNP